MTVTIGRRELLATVGGAAAVWPFAVAAQQSAIPVIGFLDATDTDCDRVAAADEHDGYGRGGSPGHAQGGNWADDHGHLPMRQICRECWQAIELVLRPTEFDCYIVAVDEPRFLQAITEC